MIVHNLDCKGVGIVPTEADAPLIVDPNAVLAAPVICKRLQPVAWNRSRIR